MEELWLQDNCFLALSNGILEIIVWPQNESVHVSEPCEPEILNPNTKANPQATYTVS